MRERISIAILMLAACFVSGCNDERKASKAEAMTEASGKSYRQGSGDYVELVELTIRDQEDVVFTGFLIEPFTHEKLRIEISGTAQFDGYRWTVSTRDDIHDFDLIYRFLSSGDIECVLVNVSKDKTRYSGQWPFTGIPNQ